MDKHIIYYSVNKKMPMKALNKKLGKKFPLSKSYNRLDTKTNTIKPLNINISLTTPKFHLRVLIKSLPVSAGEFLVSSSCLLITR